MTLSHSGPDAASAFSGLAAGDGLLIGAALLWSIQVHVYSSRNCITSKSITTCDILGREVPRGMAWVSYSQFGKHGARPGHCLMHTLPNVCCTTIETALGGPDGCQGLRHVPRGKTAMHFVLYTADQVSLLVLLVLQTVRLGRHAAKFEPLAMAAASMTAMAVLSDVWLAADVSSAVIGGKAADSVWAGCR